MRVFEVRLWLGGKLHKKTWVLRRVISLGRCSIVWKGEPDAMGVIEVRLALGGEVAVEQFTTVKGQGNNPTFLLTSFEFSRTALINIPPPVCGSETFEFSRKVLEGLLSPRHTVFRRWQLPAL